MPHVLLMDPFRLPAGISEQLSAWGVTTAVRELRDGAVVPGVQECDAVIVSGHATWLESGEVADGSAPVLVVGGQDSPELAWSVVTFSALEEGTLRPALESCFARARALRTSRSAAPLRENYHDLVGHELRTPLTAIRTALDELAVGSAVDAADRQRLLDIARRNAQRLQDTLGWSLDVLALAESPSPAVREVLKAMAEAGLVQPAAPIPAEDAIPVTVS